MTEERKQVTEYLRHLCIDITATLSAFDANAMVVRTAISALRAKFPQARFTPEEAISGRRSHLLTGSRSLFYCLLFVSFQPSSLDTG